MSKAINDLPVWARNLVDKWERDAVQLWPDYDKPLPIILPNEYQEFIFGWATPPSGIPFTVRANQYVYSRHVNAAQMPSDMGMLARNEGLKVYPDKLTALKAGRWDVSRQIAKNIFSFEEARDSGCESTEKREKTFSSLPKWAKVLLFETRLHAIQLRPAFSRPQPISVNDGICKEGWLAGENGRASLCEFTEARFHGKWYRTAEEALDAKRWELADEGISEFLRFDKEIKKLSVNAGAAGRILQDTQRKEEELPAERAPQAGSFF